MPRTIVSELNFRGRHHVGFTSPLIRFRHSRNKDIISSRRSVYGIQNVYNEISYDAGQKGLKLFNLR